MAERLFVDVSPQGTLVAPTPQARQALAKRSGRWVLMPSTTSLLLLSQWEGPESPMNDGAERAILLGEVGGVGLLDLLSLFSQTRRSVRIVVSKGRTERAILLRDGEIASVASSDARDRLGEFLVRIGKLTPQALSTALTTAQQTGRKLGQHLVASAMLSSHELWSAIQQQIMEIICDVVGWTEGTYAVFSLPEGFTFPQTPPLATQALVLEAVRRSDEMGLFRAKIPSYDAALVPTGKMPKDASPTELACLNIVEAGMTVREVGAKLQRGEFEATKIVYNLVIKGSFTVAARAGGAVASQPQKPAPPPAPPPMPAMPTMPAMPMTTGLAPTVGSLAAVPAALPVAMGTMPPSMLAAAPLPAGPAQTRINDVMRVFSMALREIDMECRKAGQGEAYRRGIFGFLVDPQNAYHGIFAGVAIGPDGDVDEQLVTANAGATGGADPLRAVFDAMNELTFFALFQASELLDNRVDEDLARRVRMILSALQR